MSEYTELVEALRYCVNARNCKKCAYRINNNSVKCRIQRVENAAAAIEAFQAQLPKRGKWIWDDKRCIYVCSVCGLPKVRENMDRQIIKEQAYCYSCGAKMEVQDG